MAFNENQRNLDLRGTWHAWSQLAQYQKIHGMVDQNNIIQKFQQADDVWGSLINDEYATKIKKW